MSKASDAFRTISEVADWLDTPAHVLRFWESRFSQVKPVKRAGGRRYYRRDDMLLLGGIKRLLHHDGMAIKGVQKLLREKGAAHVAGLSLHQLDGEPMKTVEVSLATEEAETPAVVSDEPIFQSIGSSAETLPDDQDQMQFPGFGFSSERPKAEKPDDVKDPVPEQQPVAADVVSEPEIRSEPIDITHIPLDPDETADIGKSGLLGKLLALKTGSLAGSPLGLRDAVEKLATIAEARAKPENS